MRRARAEIEAYRARCQAEGIDNVPASTLSSRLPFLTSALHETLRMHAPIFNLRVANADGQIESSEGRPAFKFKKGECISLASSAANFDPIAHPKPHIFMADRFLSNGAFQSPQHLIAFGGGPDFCKGVLAQDCARAHGSQARHSSSGKKSTTR